jgi:hypothetical protein
MVMQTADSGSSCVGLVDAGGYFKAASQPTDFLSDLDGQTSRSRSGQIGPESN